MRLEDQLEFWVEELRKAEERWKDIPPPFYDLHYWRDIVPYERLVRMVRSKMDIPICWSGIDCLEVTDGNCSSGEHESCRKCES